MSLIDHFLTDEYSVRRMDKGGYEGGFYKPGNTKTFKVFGSLQPTNARELKLPEEGNRLKQYWKFFTDQPILTDNMHTLATGDRIEVNGDSYRVMSVEQWQGLAVDLPYYKTILYREPENS